ncbi:MAG: RHS domain-containing protein [Sterolibacteriaceae bacterium]|nr:RHS domain-containing protein [Candidatus Methylophosphatis haderslevensis]
MEKRTPGQHCHYKYDAAGRLTEARKLAVEVPAQPGQPARLRPLHSTRFDYDALGNLIAEHATDEASGRTHSLHHEHDPLGNRTQTRLPQLAGARTRRALTYLYYGSGHLHQINLAHLVDGHGAEPAEHAHQVIADIERDALHREIQRGQGGLATQYALDPLGRRLGSWTRSGLADADTFAARLAAQAAAAWPTQDGLRKHYRYDGAGELRERAHSQQGATRYDYDPIGRLLGAERNNGHTQAERFAYDPAGNLLDPARAGAAAAAPAGPRGYVRDNLVRVFEDKRYDYDGHGRLAEKRSGKHTVQRFEWDDEHRLSAVHHAHQPRQCQARQSAKADGAASATAHTTQTTRFEYDALGRRIAKTDAFGRTEFIWEGMRLIEERRGFQASAYVYEPGSYVPLACIDAVGHITEAGGLGTTQDAPKPANDATQGIAADDAQSESGNESTAEPPSNLYYFHTDQVGLPEELTDATGHIRWRAAYKAWGNTPVERWETVDLKGEAVAFVEDDAQPAIEQNLRYQGQYLDRDTGLHYNTFRYYDPDIGRFISPDPIGLDGGTNLFTYAPNPSGWVDPWGWAPGDYGKMPTIPGYQKHHNIPQELANHPAIKQSGFDVHNSRNITQLPRQGSTDPARIVHRGMHTQDYTDRVSGRLDEIANTKASPAIKKLQVEALSDELGNKLRTKRIRLNSAC